MTFREKLGRREQDGGMGMLVLEKIPTSDGCCGSVEEKVEEKYMICGRVSVPYLRM